MWFKRGRMIAAGCALGLFLSAVNLAWGQATRSSGGSVGTGSAVGAGSSIGSGGIGTGSTLGGGTGTGMGASGTGGAMGAGTGASSLASGIAGGVTTSSPTASGASTSNPIGSYYLNPMSAGKPGGTGKMTGLWTPLYTTTTTTTTGITGSINTSGVSGLTSPGSILNRRGPASTFAVAFPYDPPGASQLQTEAQRVLARSSSLTMKDSIKVKTNGQMLVLEGQVRSDQERRLAENLVRLTPGARQVENNLVVVQTGPPPRQVP
jgi:BON domain